jgi:K+-sensing histidine kinase KdpD
MPTKREMQTQRGLVEAALDIVTAKGSQGWGQVVTSRNAARSIARVAQARGAGRVLVVVPEAPRWRQLVEGDLVRAIQRRVGPAVVVEGVPAGGRQLHPQRS